MNTHLNTKQSKPKLSRLPRWLRPPLAKNSKKSRNILISSGVYWPMLALSGTIAIALFSASLNMIYPEYNIYFIGIHMLCGVIGISLTFLILKQVRRNLVMPLTHVRHWATRMHNGNLSANIPLPDAKNEFYALAIDINKLSASLHDLSSNMKEQVRKQTERSTQQSDSLSILYDVATSINQSNDLNDLLSRFLTTLKKLTRADAAAVRILSDDNQLHLIASTGINDQVLNFEKQIPLDLCSCGKAFTEAKIQSQETSKCRIITGQKLCEKQDLKMIAVPMIYRNECLGIYNLYVRESEFIDRIELKGLLNSIGQHLGVAIAKNRLETQAKRLALIEERTFLSHELHDSLAQTLVSLKFQISILRDSFHKKDYTSANKEIQNLENNLDNANADLRDLLDHFRTRMDERGLIPAVQELIHNLQTDTGIHCYFQNESQGNLLPPNYEVQVLHIIQEALSNIRKHSKADNARVVIRSHHDMWTIFIEDDGVGMYNKIKKSKPGENIGLTIMKERADHISANIQVESDPDEGTRIEFKFLVENTYSPENIVNVM